MTIRCNCAEVVFLRLEENRISSSINQSLMWQSKNARVFNNGEEAGSEKSAERIYDMAYPRSMTSFLRAGRAEEGNAVGLG